MLMGFIFLSLISLVILVSCLFRDHVGDFFLKVLLLTGFSFLFVGPLYLIAKMGVFYLTGVIAFAWFAFFAFCFSRGNKGK
jgi:hypothetical protein